MKIAKKVGKRLEKYYKDNAERSVYFYPLAVYYLNNKQYERAYEILLEGIQKFPRYALALVKVGEVLFEQGSYESALAYLETAINIQKDNVPALKFIALCYEKMEKFDKALKIYERLVELGDEESKDKMIELVSRVKVESDEIENLVEDLDSKDEEIPTIDLNDSEESDDDATVEVDSENDTAEEEATITLAKLYEKQGYINDAIDTYKKIIEKEPDNIEAKEALGRLLNDVGLGDEGANDEEG